MSNPTPSLPARPSLEQLRKRAKELLARRAPVSFFTTGATPTARPSPMRRQLPSSF
jgi:hypothetical protein